MMIGSMALSILKKIAPGPHEHPVVARGAAILIISLIILSMPAIVRGAVPAVGAPVQRDGSTIWGYDHRVYRIGEGDPNLVHIRLRHSDQKWDPWPGTDVHAEPSAAIYHFQDRSVLVINAGAKGLGDSRLELYYTRLRADPGAGPFAGVALIQPIGAPCPAWQDARLNSIELEERGCRLRRVRPMHQQYGGSVFRRVGAVPFDPGNDARVLSDAWVIFPDSLGRVRFQVNLTGVRQGRTDLPPPPETMPPLD